MRASQFREAAWLVKNGTPFHIAFGVAPDFRMDKATRTALAITFAELEGRNFNFRSWDFEKAK